MNNEALAYARECIRGLAKQYAAEPMIMMLYGVNVAEFTKEELLTVLQFYHLEGRYLLNYQVEAHAK